MSPLGGVIIRHRQSSEMMATHWPVRSIGASARADGGVPRAPRVCALTAAASTGTKASAITAGTARFIIPLRFLPPLPRVERFVEERVFARNRQGDNGVLLPGSKCHGGAAGAHHQHASAATHLYRLVVEVDTDYRVGAELGRLLLHLLYGNGLGLAQLLFVGGGA